jgi:hypothetical protein
MNHRCGEFFCDDHCRLSMKLNKQAQHDPVNGYWCRVCDYCFSSREGYLDFEGNMIIYIIFIIKKKHIYNFFKLPVETLINLYYLLTHRRGCEKLYIDIYQKSD